MRTVALILCSIVLAEAQVLHVPLRRIQTQSANSHVFTQGHHQENLRPTLKNVPGEQFVARIVVGGQPMDAVIDSSHNFLVVASHDSRLDADSVRTRRADDARLRMSARAQFDDAQKQLAQYHLSLLYSQSWNSTSNSSWYHRTGYFNPARTNATVVGHFETSTTCSVQYENFSQPCNCPVGGPVYNTTWTFMHSGIQPMSAHVLGTNSSCFFKPPYAHNASIGLGSGPRQNATAARWNYTQPAHQLFNRTNRTIANVSTTPIIPDPVIGYQLCPGQWTPSITFGGSLKDHHDGPLEYMTYTLINSTVPVAYCQMFGVWSDFADTIETPQPFHIATGMDYVALPRRDYDMFLSSLQQVLQPLVFDYFNKTQLLCSAFKNTSLEEFAERLPPLPFHFFTFDSPNDFETGATVNTRPLYVPAKNYLVPATPGCFQVMVVPAQPDTLVQGRELGVLGRPWLKTYYTLMKNPTPWLSIGYLGVAPLKCGNSPFSYGDGGIILAADHPGIDGNADVNNNNHDLSTGAIVGIAIAGVVVLGVVAVVAVVARRRRIASLEVSNVEGL